MCCSKFCWNWSQKHFEFNIGASSVSSCNKCGLSLCLFLRLCNFCTFAVAEILKAYRQHWEGKLTCQAPAKCQTNAHWMPQWHAEVVRNKMPSGISCNIRDIISYFCCCQIESKLRTSWFCVLRDAPANWTILYWIRLHQIGFKKKIHSNKITRPTV